MLNPRILTVRTLLGSFGDLVGASVGPDVVVGK